METSDALSKNKTGSSQFVDLIKRFWHWWVGELTACLPDVLTERFTKRGQYLIAELHGDLCDIRFGARGKLDLIGNFSIDSQPSDHNYQYFNNLSQRADQTILLLPQTLLLENTIRLPLATENNLSNVLKYEIDRYTPFVAEQVYYGFTVVGRDPVNQQLDVSIKLVMRDVLDPILNRFQQLGFQPDVVAPAAEASKDIYSVNLLPKKDTAPHKASGFIGTHWRWLGVIMLILIAVTVVLNSQANRISELEEAVIVPKAKAEQSKIIEEDIRLLKESRAFLTDKKTKTHSTLKLLQQLTDTLPDHTWITQFELKEQSVRIQGESRQASLLIGLLDELPEYQDVRFASPVTLNTRTRKESFVIMATLTTEEVR